MPSTPSLVFCFGSSSRRCSAASAWRCGAKVSRRGRRRDSVPVMDFCFSPLVASGRRFLRRRREGGRGCAGAAFASPFWLAVIWRTSASVLMCWSVDGGSGSASRRRRRERPDLEVEDRLGEDPRPACHSDRWVPRVLLIGVFKASRRWSSFNLGLVGCCSFLSRRLGVGDDGRLRSGGAESFEDVVVISISFGVLSAICTVFRVLLDSSVGVYVYGTVFYLLI